MCRSLLAGCTILRNHRAAGHRFFRVAGDEFTTMAACFCGEGFQLLVP